MVYVISENGQPLMPTSRHGKVRRLLNNKKAKVVKRCPFTIQLLYEPATSVVQNITLGVDAGSKHIGLSATTETQILYEADVELRNDIVELLSTRREFRRARRNRKTRYRKPRFNNRVKHKEEGWLAPSIQEKIGTHLKVIQEVHSLLPISEIIVEVASFDMQKLKADMLGLTQPKGKDYQEGEQLGFWNAREYVFYRDGHTCQCCHGKSKDKRLNVHHIESRMTGGDAPNNLITLCETCHQAYHKGTITFPSTIKRGIKFNDAVFMGIMRWALYNQLKETYKNVSMTYGYITKSVRIKNELPKDHCIDARCISGHPKAAPIDEMLYIKKVRSHNRQLHKATIQKSGIRRNNQAPYEVKGFRLFDKVKAKGKEWYIHGRRLYGCFVLKTFNKETLNIVPNKIKLLYRQQNYIIERRGAFLPAL